MTFPAEGIPVTLKAINGMPVMTWPDAITVEQHLNITAWLNAWNGIVRDQTLDQTAGILRRRNMESKI